MTQNRNNLLSQRTPQTVTNIIHIITPFSDIGKLFTVTIHKNWHAIANDTTLHYLDIQTLISLYQIQQHSQPLCPCCTSIWLLMAGFLTPLPIYIHIYQYRHTHCDIVRVTYTVATIPPPPYQTYQTNLGTTENIIEHQNMLWRSRYHPMIMRHTNAQTLMLIIKEAQSYIVHNKFVWIQ